MRPLPPITTIFIIVSFIFEQAISKPPVSRSRQDRNARRSEWRRFAERKTGSCFQVASNGLLQFFYPASAINDDDLRQKNDAIQKCFDFPPQSCVFDFVNLRASAENVDLNGSIVGIPETENVSGVVLLPPLLYEIARHSYDPRSAKSSMIKSRKPV
jgi:hypothetical protein